MKTLTIVFTEDEEKSNTNVVNSGFSNLEMLGVIDVIKQRVLNKLVEDASKETE